MLKSTSTYKCDQQKAFPIAAFLPAEVFQWISSVDCFQWKGWNGRQKVLDVLVFVASLAGKTKPIFDLHSREIERNVKMQIVITSLKYINRWFTKK